MDNIILIILIYTIPCSIGILIANYVFNKYYSKGLLNKLILTKLQYGAFIIVGLDANSNSFVCMCSLCNSYQSINVKYFLKDTKTNNLDCDYCKKWSK